MTMKNLLWKTHQLKQIGEKDLLTSPFLNIFFVILNLGVYMT